MESKEVVKRDAHNLLRGFAAFSDAGSQIPLNEDSYFTDTKVSLFCVADGYGGQGVGEPATQSVYKNMDRFVRAGLGDAEVTLPYVFRSYYTDAANLLFNAMLFANTHLVHENKSKSIHSRAGLSLLAALVEGNRLTLANVGLNQAVLLRRSRVQVLCRPRSYNSLRGVFSGSWNGKWAFPIMSMGHQLDLEPEVVELQLEPNDIVILMTDGVYPRLTEEDYIGSLKAGLAEKAVDLGLSKQNHSLVDLALQRGALDNQAMITLLF